MTFWLSFADPNKPKGSQFLGVAVIDVDDLDAEYEKSRLNPRAMPGAEWLAAAVRRAWEMGCNPGGEVQAHPVANCSAPRDRLLSENDLRRLDLI